MKKYLNNNQNLISHILGLLFCIPCIYYLIYSCNYYSGFISASTILALSFFFQSIVYILLCFWRDKLIYRVLVFYSIFSHFILIFAPVVLTSDIYRYLWEGFVIRNGFNPYKYSPDNLNLQFLQNVKTHIWLGVDHKHLSAIYPPLSEYFLKIFGTTEIVWKVFIFFCNLLTLYISSLVLKIKKIKKENLFFLAFLPVFLIETTWSGHLEAILILLTVLFCCFFELYKRKQSKKNILFLALSMSSLVCIKYVSILPIGIFILKEYRAFKNSDLYLLVLSSVLLIFLMFLPFFDYDLSVFSSLEVYLKHWRHNDSLLHLFGTLTGADWDKLETFSYIKNLLLLFFIISTLFLIRKFKDPYKISALSFGIFLLCSSTVHPWYVLWFACFLPFYNSKWLIAFAVLVPISYYSQIYDLKELPVFIKIVEYLPVCFLLILSKKEFLCWEESL